MSLDPDLSGWTSRERSLLTIADEICASDTMGDLAWTTTTAALATLDIIEALVVVGYYRMVCAMENALGVPAEQDFTPTISARD